MPFLALSQYSGCANSALFSSPAFAPAAAAQAVDADHRGLHLVHLFDELSLAVEVEVRHEWKVLPVLDLVQVVLLLEISDDMSALK